MTEWWPGYPDNEYAGFQVRRRTYGTLTGGDFVRGSTVATMPNAILRYQTTDPEVVAEIEGKGVLVARPKDYSTAWVTWDWPDFLDGEASWNVVLVRSAFGVPSTPNDGQVVMAGTDLDFTVTEQGTQTLEDGALPSGRWYYYALFYNLASQPLDWTRGATDSVQIPRDFMHRDHLWNALPPYYRYLDEQQKVGTGPLRDYLSIFGFELDTMRQFAEFTQDMHHVDLSPIPLLREVGSNHGVENEQGLGDIRFRALMANLPQRLLQRGTRVALESSCETMSKYPTEVTPGYNLMLLTDDADPYYSTGSWGHDHTNLDFSAVGTPATSSLTLTLATDSAPAEGGRGYLRIDSPDSGALLATCGCGEQGSDEFLPLTTGIPVTEGDTYGFSGWIRCESTPLTPNLVMLWFGVDGQPGDLIAITEGTPETAVTDWSARYKVEGTAPAGAAFVVPAVWVSDRAGEYIDISSMVVYLISRAEDGIAVLTPDQLLTLGDPNEEMGEPTGPGDTPANFPGYAMGAPGTTDSGQENVESLNAFFTDAFLNATDGLEFTNTVLDGDNLRLVLFRNAPTEGDFSGYDTVAELTSLPGWVEASGGGYPLTDTQVAGTRNTISGVEYHPFTSFVLTDLTEPVEVQAVGIQIVGTLGGKTDPLLLVAPLLRRTTVRPDDVVTAPVDANLGVRWWVSWDAGAPDGAARVASVTAAQLAVVPGPPPFQQANTFDVNMYPQRVNYICNPSFEAATNDYWGTDGSFTRIANAELGGFCGRFTMNSGYSNAESNVFPAVGQDYWTVQFKVKTDAAATVQVGLVSWDDTYATTYCDWGPVTDVWDATTDWIHVRAVRRSPDAEQAMLVVRGEGSSLILDEVLVEPGVLLEWPYFDGDETFGARDDFSWRGVQGESYSYWYNNRNGIYSRLFTSPGLPDPTYEFTEEQVRQQGLAYNWVPAGTDIIANLDVLYPGDLKANPPTKSGLNADTPYRYFAATAPADNKQGTTWVEDGTGDIYVSDGTTWVQIDAV